MRQEWAWFVEQQAMFYEELVSYQLAMPRRRASQMRIDIIDGLHRAWNRIRGNNRMKIHQIDIGPKPRFMN